MCPRPRMLALLLTVLAVLVPWTAVHAQFDSLSKVSVSARVSPRKVAPGGQAVIAVIMDHQRGWHSWTNPGNNPPGTAVFDGAINTQIKSALVADSPAVLHLKETQWPKVYSAKADLGDGVMNYAVFTGKAVIFVPVTIKPDAKAGPAKIELLITFQSCDDKTCMAPVEDHPVSATIEIDPAATDTISKTDVFAEFDASVFAKIDPKRGGTSPPDVTPPAPVTDGASSPVDASPQPSTIADAARPTFFGIKLPRLDGALGMFLLIILSMLGGFILNLTPCVLPIIPLKIMTISQHANTPGKSMMLGLWMAAGVVAFWAGIGIPAALFTSWADPSRLFGIWWLTLGIGLLIAGMGLGIMGLFTIQLPQAVYAVNPKADSPGGSFLFGVMTAVLGLPCFGFVAGALLAGAATLPPVIIMLIFTSMGIGMAAPYLVLSAKPALVNKIPRTGPASELVKQVMGLLLLAAAAYFIGSGLIALVSEQPYMAKVLHWWAAAICAIAAGLWLTIRTFQITTRPVRRTSMALIGLVLGGGALLIAIDSTREAMSKLWRQYTPDSFAKARAAGQIVVLDFTAEWCLTCKVLKRTVLDPEPVRSALAAKDVVPFLVDLTSRKDPGWELLGSLGQTGIPTLAIYTPGSDAPWVANAYTADQVITALDQARTRTIVKATP